MPLTQDQKTNINRLCQAVSDLGLCWYTAETSPYQHQHNRQIISRGSNLWPSNHTLPAGVNMLVTLSDFVTASWRNVFSTEHNCQSRLLRRELLVKLGLYNSTADLRNEVESCNDDGELVLVSSTGLAITSPNLEYSGTVSGTAIPTIAEVATPTATTPPVTPAVGETAVPAATKTKKVKKSEDAARTETKNLKNDIKFLTLADSYLSVVGRGFSAAARYGYSAAALHVYKLAYDVPTSAADAPVVSDLAEFLFFKRFLATLPPHRLTHAVKEYATQVSVLAHETFFWSRFGCECFESYRHLSPATHVRPAGCSTRWLELSDMPSWNCCPICKREPTTATAGVETTST